MPLRSSNRKVTLTLEVIIAQVHSQRSVRGNDTSENRQRGSSLRGSANLFTAKATFRGTNKAAEGFLGFLAGRSCLPRKLPLPGTFAREERNEYAAGQSARNDRWLLVGDIASIRGRRSGESREKQIPHHRSPKSGDRVRDDIGSDSSANVSAPVGQASSLA